MVLVVLLKHADRLTLTPKSYFFVESRAEAVGFSAQAVAEVMPEAVSNSTLGYLQLNSDPILWKMVNSMKEQQTQIEEQRKLIETQQAAIDELKLSICSVKPDAKGCLQR